MDKISCSVLNRHILLFFFYGGIWKWWRCICLPHLEKVFHVWTEKQSVHTFVAPTGRSDLCRPESRWWNLLSRFFWARHGSDITGFTAVQSGGDGGARLQMLQPKMWECSSVREKWSEVNRKRLIYTAVITLVFSYPRREKGRQCEDGGEESDAWGGLKDGSFRWW